MSSWTLGWVPTQNGNQLLLHRIHFLPAPIKKRLQEEGCSAVMSFKSSTHIWWGWIHHRINGRGGLQFASFYPFELWCQRRLLRVSWTARRSNQSILKEINLEYSLEGLMLKLKLQYFGYLMQRIDLLEKTLMLGKIEGRRRGWQDEMVGRNHQFSVHEFEQTPGDGEQLGSQVCSSLWGLIETNTTEQLNNNNNHPLVPSRHIHWVETLDDVVLEHSHEKISGEVIRG